MTRSPRWFPKNFKNLIQKKNNADKSYQNSKNNNNIQHSRILKFLQEDLRKAI